MTICTLNRQIFSPRSTIGEWFFPEGKHSDTLELSTFKPDEKGLLAIRPGLYDLRLDPSPKWERDMWEIFGVPREDGKGNRVGLLVHPANKPDQLDGCIAPGLYIPTMADWISASKPAYEKLFERLNHYATLGPIKLRVIGWAEQKAAA